MCSTTGEHAGKRLAMNWRENPLVALNQVPCPANCYPLLAICTWHEDHKPAGQANSWIVDYGKLTHRRSTSLSTGRLPNVMGTFSFTIGGGQVMLWAKKYPL